MLPAMLHKLVDCLTIVILVVLLCQISIARRFRDKSRSKNRKGTITDTTKTCDFVECHNDGVCIFDGKVERCRCQQGYTGEFCELREREHPILEWASSHMQTKTMRPPVTSMIALDCRVGYKNWTRDYMYSYSTYWLKNGLPIKFNNSRLVNLVSIIELHDLRPSDGGNYTCVVEAGGHQKHWSYFVEVESAPISSVPVIIKSPVNRTAVQGSTVVFNCELSPYLSGEEMIWIKHIFINGSWGEGKIQPNDSHIAVLKPWNLTHQPLILNDIKLKDQGFYTCGARNKFGNDYQSAWLTVLTEKKPDDDGGFLIRHVIIIVSSAFVLTAIIITGLVYARYRKLRKMRLKRTQLYYSNKDDSAARSLFKDRRISSSSSSSSCSFGSSTRSRSRIPSHDPWEFPRNRLQIQGLLGEGAFGQVKKAIAHGIGRVPKSCEVAVKTIKNNATKTEEIEFVKEVEVMKAVRELGSHLNVINFLGYCTRGGPLWMIEEFADKGSLKDVLVSLRSQVNCQTDLSMDLDSSASGGDCGDKLSQKLLVSFCHQVARGMEFLASVKCIHRDLAARNVLVTKDNVLKVADFGLARSGDYYKKTSEGQLPIKWMPPEALLHMLYTEKSDVWSFGVLMWEIFSLGGMPYANIRHEHLYLKLIAGYRMERPHFAPESLYSTMKKCWSHLPEDRPDFSILVLILERQLVRIANGGYIEVLAEEETGTL